MEHFHARLLLLLLCFVYSYQYGRRAGYGVSVENAALEWARMETVIGEEVTEAPAPQPKLWRSFSRSGSSVPQARLVPEYKIISSANDPKEYFRPGKGYGPLSKSVQDMLLAATVAPAPKAARPRVVEILCHVDRIYVRIIREVFKTRDAYKHLKLGNCPVNQGTKAHYYFLYLLTTDCAFKTEAKVDDVTISNVLSFKPPGPAIREIPFDVPLQCKYPRYFHSFKVGFYPQLEGGTVHKALQPKSSFTISPQDASGNEITGAKTYTLGQPMFFEAKGPGATAKSGDQRIYIRKCFITASQDYNSKPNYAVIDNLGCMIDGKVTNQSRFLTCSSKMIQKFSVGALIFDTKISSSSSSQQLYMHCDIAVGNLTPTQSLKACNYDAKTKKWKERSGNHDVCTCCDSTCFSTQSKASKNIISSHSWKIDMSSKDAEVEPRMKYFEADALDLEDPDIAEHRDFLNYWESDY